MQTAEHSKRYNESADPQTFFDITKIAETTRIQQGKTLRTRPETLKPLIVQGKGRLWFIRLDLYNGSCPVDIGKTNGLLTCKS